MAEKAEMLVKVKAEVDTSEVKKAESDVKKSVENLGKTISGMGEKVKGAFKDQVSTISKQRDALVEWGESVKSFFGKIFDGVSKIVDATKEGFQNLAQYSDNTNESISSVMSALTQLKNSFAAAFEPILSVVAPILTTFINMISEAVTNVGMFIAALTGQSTFIKATDVQQNYADGSSTPAEDMFTTVSVESSMVDLANNIKSIFENVFTPFKDAWQMEGKTTIDAVKDAFSSLGELAASVGGSISAIWSNGTGVTILSTILQIGQGILATAGSLAARFGEAWNTNEVGTQIIQNIANAVLSILDFINSIVSATSEWTSQLDFYPLLEAISGLFSSLSPVIVAIGNWLSKIYTEIILPVAQFLIENVFPVLINILSGFFEFLGENQWLIEGIGAALIMAFSYSTLNPLITAIQGALSGGLVPAISAVISIVKTAILGLNPLTLVIAAVIAVIVLLITNWDAVVATMQMVIDWVSSVWTKLWQNNCQTWSNICDAFFSGVQQIFGGLKDICNGFISFIKGIFSGDWEQAWEGVKQIFKGIWDTLAGIINTPINLIIAAVNGLVSGVVIGINAVISALNKIHFTTPDWLPGKWGGKSFGFNIPQLTAHKIPYLATGAVIPPNKEFLAVLGDQKQGRNIETPESLLKNIFREELSKQKSTGGTYRFVGQINRRTLFEEVIEEAKLRQTASGRNPFELA